MTPRAVASHRVIRGQLVRTLDCGHVQRVSAPPKLDLRTLPRTVPTCAECEKGPSPPKAA